MAPSPSISRTDWLALAAILVLGLALRLLKLDAGLWYDEVDTLVSHTRPPFSHLLTHFPSLNHHILFSLQAKASIAIFGETAFAVRLPAALLGVASLAALWLLAREVGQRGLAHLTTLLMAVSYHHVWFSQNARGYTGLLTFGLLAVLFHLRGRAAEAKAASRRNAILVAVSAALMLYTHLSAAFLLVSLGVVHLATVARAFRGRAPDADERRRLLWPLLGLAGGALLALVLFLPIVPDLVATFSEKAGPRAVEGARAESISHWNSPLWMVKEVVGAFAGLGPLILFGAAGVMLVVGAGMLEVFRRGHVALPLTFLLHVPLTVFVLQLASMRVWPRYFFLDIGFICLFLLEGAVFFGRQGERLLARFSRWSPPAGRLGGVLGVLGVLGALGMLPKNYRHPKQDLVGARDFVEASRSPGSRVAALGLASLPFSQYYAPAWGHLESLPELLSLEQASPEVWVVYAFPDVTEERYPAVLTRLDYSFERPKLFRGTLGDGNVLVFKSKYGKAGIDVVRLGPTLFVLYTRGLIGGNILVLAEGDDVVMVDSNAEPMGKKLADAMEGVTSKPVRFLIDTHWHLDHAGGNAPFARAGATVIAHAKAAKRLEQDLSRREEPSERRLPTQLVTGDLTLPLAGQEIRVLHAPSAHTDGDLFVHFVGANVIHTGDLFVHGSFPFISQGSGGTIDGYVAAQERILGLANEETRLVPGHGEVARRRDLVRTLEMLKTARERVRGLKEKGQTLEQVTAADPLSDMQATWGGSSIDSKLMAKFIYTTLGSGAARASEPPARGSGS